MSKRSRARRWRCQVREVTRLVDASMTRPVWAVYTPLGYLALRVIAHHARERLRRIERRGRGLTRDIARDFKRVQLVAAAVLVWPALAGAQDRVSASLVGRAWSVESAIEETWRGEHRIALAASRERRGDARAPLDTHAAWDYARGWLRTGVESRNRASLVSGHLGAGFTLDSFEADLGLTTGARPRLAVRWTRTLGGVTAAAGLVAVPAVADTAGVTDLRLTARWRGLSAELWRMPDSDGDGVGEWMPRAALVLEWGR